MKFPSSTSFALLGAALIAISFGLARFAFGLFVPPIRAELELSPDMIGIIGALPLISFILATLVAPLAASRACWVLICSRDSLRRSCARRPAASRS